MRILLASGIFYPDVGGPATHVRKIAERLSGNGWTVTVVAFGDHEEKGEGYRVVRISRHRSRVLSWGIYGFTILREAARHDIIYGFDLTTAGIPSAVAAVVLRKPLVLRLGGDPIWEREVESGRRFLSLREYYSQRLHKIDRPTLYFILRRVLAAADRIVVYNDFFRDFFSDQYGADLSRISVIRNPLLPREHSVQENHTRTFIFAGRFVAYKNLANVIRAAARLKERWDNVRLLFVGDGPEHQSLAKLASELHVPLEIRPKADQKTLFQYIRSSSVAIAPALSEFNPNFILESISLGKPVLISKGHGLSVRVPAYMEFDARDEASLAAAMERMMGPEYAQAVEDISAIPMQWSWDDVLDAQETMLRTVL